jgi:hypothetical protein
MDEQLQFRTLLRAVQPYLPSSVVATCESLNEHGEWEEALSHCRFHLDAVADSIPDSVRELVAACAIRLKSSSDA